MCAGDERIEKVNRGGKGGCYLKVKSERGGSPDQRNKQGKHTEQTSEGGNIKLKKR